MEHGYAEDKSKVFTETVMKKALSDSSVMSELKKILNEKNEEQTRAKQNLVRMQTQSSIQGSDYYTILEAPTHKEQTEYDSAVSDFGGVSLKKKKTSIHLNLIADQDIEMSSKSS